jgi:tripartite-type tricarboxylate transporter receptor subunit TctC
MKISGLFIAVLAVSLAAASGAAAQTYPAKPIRMVVGFVAGGPTDALARLYAQRLGGSLGQQVVVENRGGADGVIAAEAVARSAPDGYTLFFPSSGHAINASLYKSLSYRTLEDFEPIALVGESPNLIAVPPSLPVRDLREFIALAKSKPGALNYGATSSPTFLATELFTSMAGIQITRIPFKGAAPAMTALMSGDAQLVLSGIGTTLPQVKGGKLKGLAVTGASRSPLALEIPTVVESGIPGYVATTWYGVLAPAGTQRPIVERLNRETLALLEVAATKNALAVQGVVSTPMTPEEFGSFLRTEVAKWAKVVQDTGAKAE